MNLPLNKTTAIRLHQANQLAQAQAIYQKLLQQTPHDAELWHRVGALYLQQNQLALAQNALETSLVYQKKSPVLWLHYGVVLGSLNQHQLAQQSFESGLACQTTVNQQVDLYYHHAIALNKQQNLTSSPPLNGEDSFYKTAMSCRTLHLVTRTFLFGEVLIPSLPYLSDY